MSLWKYSQSMSVVLFSVLSCAATAMAQSPATTNAPGPDEVGVSLDEPIQKDFLGVNAVYHGVAFMPEQVRKGMDDADRKREFDRVAAMKLNIARTWYGPEMVYSNDYSKWSFETTYTNAPDWKSPHMLAFYAWLKEMKDRHVDVALQLGWFFPAHTKVSPSYAEWVSESLHQMIELRGFTNIQYGILFTEPPYNEEYRKMALALDERLKKDGRRKLIKIVGANQDGEGRDLAKTARELNDVIDIYSGHTYSRGGYADWKKSAEGMMRKVASTGKPFWYDEFGMAQEPRRQVGEYGYYLAQATAGFINAGAQTATLWLLFDQQYTVPGDDWDGGKDSFYHGVHRWGTCKWPRDKVQNPTYPYPSWYAFSLMSRYMGGRNGTQSLRTRCASDLWIAATRHPSGDSSFLVINGRGSSRAVSVQLSRPLGRTLYRYLYDPSAIVPTEAATLIGYSKTVPDVGASFTDELPGHGVAIYSTLKDEPVASSAAPTGLVAVLEGERSVRLSWKVSSADAQGFKIERREGTGGYVPLQTVAADTLTFTDHTAYWGTPYAYRVSGVLNGAVSPPAEAAIAVPAVKKLLAHWPLDVDGTNSVAGGAPLGLEGVTFIANGADGKGAARFEGREKAVSGEMILGNSFSIAMWFRVDTNAANIQMLVANTSGSQTADGFDLFVNTWGTANRGLSLQAGNGKDGTGVSTGAGAVEFGKWQHLVLAMSRGEGSATLYLDGKKVASGAVRGDFRSSGPLRLGAMTNGDCPLHGELDDVRVYSYVLSAEEIGRLAEKRTVQEKR